MNTALLACCLAACCLPPASMPSLLTPAHAAAPSHAPALPPGARAAGVAGRRLLAAHLCRAPARHRPLPRHHEPAGAWLGGCLGGSVFMPGGSGVAGELSSLLSHPIARPVTSILHPLAVAPQPSPPARRSSRRGTRRCSRRPAGRTGTRLSRLRPRAGSGGARRSARSGCTSWAGPSCAAGGRCRCAGGGHMWGLKSWPPSSLPVIACSPARPHCECMVCCAMACHAAPYLLRHAARPAP